MFPGDFAFVCLLQKKATAFQNIAYYICKRESQKK